MDEKEQRPIDQVMAIGHPSKAYVRDEWGDEIEFRAGQSNKAERYLYTTLCGRHALDIKLLVDKHLIHLLENGAIDLEKSRRVVAFEMDAPAAAEIKRQFPGLEVREINIHDELKLAQPLNFPEGSSNKARFQACVINLDYDRSAQIVDAAIVPIRAIAKIGQIQQAKKLPWSLLLTLNASIGWSSEDQEIEKRFLAECVDHCPEAAAWLSSAHPAVLSGQIDLSKVDKEDSLAFVSFLVVARLAEALSSHGWRLTVHRAFTYGTQEGRAPMASWIIRMAYHADAERRRSEFIEDALKSLIGCTESIANLDDPQD